MIGTSDIEYYVENFGDADCFRLKSKKLIWTESTQCVRFRRILHISTYSIIGVYPTYNTFNVYVHTRTCGIKTNLIINSNLS
jgi:hypothetical protein